MSTFDTCSYPPAARQEHLDRLVVFDPQADAAFQDWTEVHKQVQNVLAGLDDSVRSSVAHLRAESGRTRGRNFDLFTYRTFSRTDAPDIDPVVVGMTFARADSGDEERVTIDAEISGEGTGDRIAVLVQRTASPFQAELLHLARELATQLSQYAHGIAKALLDPSRST